MKPLISIIIPAYKDLYLAECMDSIISQGYDNWQLVIVNDNSPHDIDSVVGRYDDPRIFYSKRQTGYGSERLVDNWNDCLAKVSGDYVINMGDDDILLPGCLEEYARLINLFPSVDVFHGWTEIIDEKSQVIDVCPQHPRHESVYAFMQRIWKGETLYIGDVLIRTSVLRGIGGYQNYPLAWHSDHITAFDAAACNGVVSTEKIVFGYRKHSRTISMSKQNVALKLDADIEAFGWYAGFLASGPADGSAAALLRQCLVDMLPYMRRRKICQDISEGCKHKPWKVLAFVPYIMCHKLGVGTVLRAVAYSF